MGSTNVVSGARAAFKVNNSKIAYAFGVEVNEEIVQEPLHVLDRLAVQENTPVAYQVGMSAEIFRTIKGAGSNIPAAGAQSSPDGSIGSPKDMGLFPKVGQDELNAFLVAEMTALLLDKLDNTTLAKVLGVKAASQNMSIRSRQVTGVNVRFTAIRQQDESES